MIARQKFRNTIAMDIVEQIKQQIAAQPVLIYMKGSPAEPRCGFSDKAVKILQACNASFHFVDVLANPQIRQTLPQVSNWPTFPQLFIHGELIGGSDIIGAHYETGILQRMLQPTAELVDTPEEKS